MDWTKVVVYKNLKSEIDVIIQTLTATGAEEADIDDYVCQQVFAKNFTLIGLFTKPALYLQGIKQYTKYYSTKNPAGNFELLAIKKAFTDVTAPLVYTVQIQAAVDANNSIYFSGDFTDHIDNGDVYTILDGTTQAPKGQYTVQSASFDVGTDLTTVILSNFEAGAIVTGDIAYFSKGLELTGLVMDVDWYDINENIALSKRVTITLSTAEASAFEYRRRYRTIQQMTQQAKGTTIMPHVTAITDHFALEITNYQEYARVQEFKDAIDNLDPVAYPKIEAYLEIEIPFTDVEGVTAMKKIRDWMKDELYVGYTAQ